MKRKEENGEQLWTSPTKMVVKVKHLNKGLPILAAFQKKPRNLSNKHITVISPHCKFVTTSYKSTIRPRLTACNNTEPSLTWIDQ